MYWYYMDKDTPQKRGPVDEDLFIDLVCSGIIGPKTLVWNDQINQWVPFAEVDINSTQYRPEQLPGWDDTPTCRECDSPLLPYESHNICTNCQSILDHELIEGVSRKPKLHAGFWARAVAKTIDVTILTALAGSISIFAPTRSATQFATTFFTLGLCYTTCFPGLFAATPGKMVLGLKIVTADRKRVSYSRAFNRYFVEWLSLFVLSAGYLMAPVDPEKRTLHDRICHTRVIRKEHR